MLRSKSSLHGLFCAFVLIAAPAFGQTGGAGNLDNLKAQISSASSTSVIEKILKKAEKTVPSLSDVVSLRSLAYAVLQNRMVEARLGMPPAEANATFELYHDNAVKLRKDLEKLIVQLETNTLAEFELVNAKVELARFHESYEPRRTGPKRMEEDRSTLARVQALYADALAIENKRSGMSPNSLAIRVVLADSYVRSADFEKALPLYEEYVDGVSRVEGPDSKARIRALISIAKIAQIAGDEPRFNQHRKELEQLAVSLENSSDISLRADPDSKGLDSPFGFIHVEPYIYTSRNSQRVGISSPGGRPLVKAETGHQALTSRMFTGVPTLVSVDAAGAVASIEVRAADAKIRRSVETLVKRWKFRPLIYKGSPTTMKGIVYCWVKMP